MTDPDALPAVMLRAGIRTGDPKLISFPLAQLIAPLLFRGLDLKTVDTQTISQMKFASRDADGADGEERTVNDLLGDRLETVIHSTSRELAEFGSVYAHQPGSPLFRLACESNNHYHSMMDRLETFTAESPLKETTTVKSETSEGAPDTNTEAIIQALEGGGATIVRQMQLSTQFYRFKPPLQRRLSQTLDTNPGLSKLAAWENLYRWSNENQELQDYLNRIEILEKVGAGSLKTVFAAREQDTGTDVVLRIQNPNSKYFVQEGHRLTTGIYDETERQMNGGHRREIRIGRMMNDMARKWCLRELSDTRFSQDDQRFRRVIRQLDNKFDARIQVPEIRLDVDNVMSVVRSPGITANQLLNSDAPPKLKRRIARMITELNSAQTEFDSLKITDEYGQKYIVVHSDQHLGNFMVYVDENGRPVVDIIDTDMYLRLEEADVEILDRLRASGNDKEFVYVFIDRIMDINNLQGTSRKTSKAWLLRALAPEYARQMLRRKTDKLLLLQTIFDSCAQQDLDIPLRIQIMIRNAAADMNLRSEQYLD